MDPRLLQLIMSMISRNAQQANPFGSPGTSQGWNGRPTDFGPPSSQMSAPPLQGYYSGVDRGAMQNPRLGGTIGGGGMQNPRLGGTMVGYGGGTPQQQVMYVPDYRNGGMMVAPRPFGQEPTAMQNLNPFRVR